MLYEVRCRSTDISSAIAGSALRSTSSVTGSTRTWGSAIMQLAPIRTMSSPLGATRQRRRRRSSSGRRRVLPDDRRAAHDRARGRAGRGRRSAQSTGRGGSSSTTARDARSAPRRPPSASRGNSRAFAAADRGEAQVDDLDRLVRPPGARSGGRAARRTTPADRVADRRRARSAASTGVWSGNSWPT